VKKFVAAMLVAVIALGLAAPAVAQVLPTASRNYVWEEINEPNRLALNANMNQRNNLDVIPTTWTRILDAVYAPQIPATAYFAGPVRMYEAATGENMERSDIILPGASLNWAHYGFWNDTDGDGILEARNICSANTGGCVPRNDANGTNEWARDPAGLLSGPIGPDNATYGGEIVSFIEPGMHNDIFSNSRPGPNTPDFRWSWLPPENTRPGQWNSPFYMVWYDGSLFQKLTWKTLVNATLTPSGNSDPFECTVATNCLLDVDVYSAVAPGPVEALYGATLAPTVNSLPPVNFAITNTPTPPEPVVAALEPVNYAFAPFPAEYDDPRSSAGQVGYENYTQDYHAWMDFTSRYIVTTGVISGYYESFAFGGPKGNDASSPPGLWGGALYTGVWKDINGDGIIGEYVNDAWPENENPGSEDNRYYYGWNMEPNNYNDDTGEWFGFFPEGCDGENLTKRAQITLTPAGGSWGTVPVLVTDPFMNDPTVWYLPDDPQGVIKGTASCNENDLAIGLWFADFSVFFPIGNEVAFDIKVDPIVINYKKGAVTVKDSVWDVDTILPFEPANKAN